MSDNENLAIIIVQDVRFSHP